MKHILLSDKPWLDILGEFVSAAIQGGFIFGFELLCGLSSHDAGLWAMAFGLGLFLRGLRP